MKLAYMMQRRYKIHFKLDLFNFVRRNTKLQKKISYNKSIIIAFPMAICTTTNDTQVSKTCKEGSGETSGE